MRAGCPNPELIAALARGSLIGEAKIEAESLLAQHESCRDLLRQLHGHKYPNIAGYTISEQVGKGGFGVVYKAVHHPTMRIVALKVLFSKAPLLTSYFENEVQLIARLRHPNIATLYDAQLGAPPLYYTMDYVDGQRLNDYVKTAAVSLSERIELIRQVAEAVGYAHGQGVVHRDIKPQNILVDPQRQPHVIDFGISTRLAPPAAESVAGDGGTRSGARASAHDGPVGTLGYIAPEVVNGQLVDGRADVFALGALLFHCVTLEPARLARDAKLRDEFIRGCRVSQPDDLSAIIGRCIETNPAKRYQTCSELAADLERYQGGRPLHARRDSALIGRWLRIGRLVLRERPLPVRCAIVALVVSFLSLLMWAVQGKYLVTHGLERQTVVIGFTDETRQAILDGRIGKDVEGLNGYNLRSWRALDGRLMEILSLARPRVVAFDHYYEEQPTPEFDAAFVRGARALADRGIPVVVGAQTFDVNGRPVVADALLPALHGIGTLIHSNADYLTDQFQVVYAFKRGFELPVPSFAVAAFAAARFPDCRPEIQLRSEDLLLEIFYRKRNPQPNARNYQDVVDEIALSDVTRIEAGDTRKLAPVAKMMVNDVVAHGMMPHFRDEDWADRLFSVHQVLNASPVELATWFDGKAIVIGGMIRSYRPFEGDLKTLRSGKQFFGVMVHAEALDRLLGAARQQRLRRAALVGFTLMWSCLAAILVSLQPVRRWHSLKKVGAVVTAVVVTGVALCVYAVYAGFEFWLVQLLVAIGTLLVAGGLTFIAKAVNERLRQLAPAAFGSDRPVEMMATTRLATADNSTATR